MQDQENIPAVFGFPPVIPQQRGGGAEAKEEELRFRQRQGHSRLVPGNFTKTCSRSRNNCHSAGRNLEQDQVCVEKELLELQWNFQLIYSCFLRGSEKRICEQAACPVRGHNDVIHTCAYLLREHERACLRWWCCYMPAGAPGSICCYASPLIHPLLPGFRKD